MSMDKQKIATAIKLEEAIRNKREAFVLLEKIDELDEKITKIPKIDLSEVNKKIDDLKDEEIEVTLEII